MWVRHVGTLTVVTAYLNVVAVKKLVVGSRQVGGGSLSDATAPFTCDFDGGSRVILTDCPGAPSGLL